MAALPSPIRVVLAVLVALVTSGVAGAVLAATGRYYLPAVWPMVGGLAVGVASALAIRLLRLPGQRRAAVIAALGGISVVSTVLVVSHSLEGAAVLEALSKSGGASPERLAREAEAGLEARAGSGPEAPIWLRLREGTPAMTARLHLGTSGNAVVLGLEAALAAIVAGLIAGRQGARPFSSGAGVWLTRQVLGCAPHGSAATIRADLEQGEFHRLGRRIDGKPGPVALVAWADERASEVVFQLEVTDAGERRARVVSAKQADKRALAAIAESRAMRGG